MTKNWYREGKDIVIEGKDIKDIELVDKKIEGSVYVKSPVEGTLSIYNINIGKSLEVKDKVEYLTVRNSRIFGWADIKNTEGRTADFRYTSIGAWLNASGVKRDKFDVRDTKILGGYDQLDENINGWLDISSGEIGELLINKNTFCEAINLRDTTINKDIFPSANLFKVNENTKIGNIRIPKQYVNRLASFDEFYEQVKRF